MKRTGPALLVNALPHHLKFSSSTNRAVALSPWMWWCKGRVCWTILQSKFTCFERPFPRKLPDGMDGSMANELLERASKTPRNNRCIAVLANIFCVFFSIVSFISEAAK